MLESTIRYSKSGLSDMASLAAALGRLQQDHQHGQKSGYHQVGRPDQARRQVRQILAEHGPMTAEAIVREMLKLGHDISIHETLRSKVTSLTISLWRPEKAGVVAREGKSRSARWQFKTSQTRTPQSR
ncbi:hypothetical protein [Bradyrhizobium cenepequi]|uniref:hypothetical protein n=1 Tax=Bradyrhizobium cenepequi TaxID=2821403 RepID=UPI001CE35561|nr:hypothetical protein [Bradyrhizobium cenepequi]MCA6109289.1 hypothetical protein [Bradyrhizobium cenepequi]